MQAPAFPSAHTLGIDVAKAKLDVALLSSHQKLRNKVVANNKKGFAALMAWLSKNKVDSVHSLHVCMEATGCYWEEVAEFLTRHGARVSVVNPLQIKRYGQSLLTRNKTDKVDAELIARFCERERPKSWCPPTENQKTLKALIIRLEALQHMRTQESNRLGVSRKFLHGEIRRHIKAIDKQMEKHRETINRLIADDPIMSKRRQLLKSIPGIGEVISSVIIAFALDPEHFKSPRQVAAFTGLSPRQFESGSSVRGRTHISKIGNVFIRKSLFLPSMAALRTKWGEVFKKRLTAAGKAKMVIVCAMMRKLIHVSFGVLKSGNPFDPKLHGVT